MNPYGIEQVRPSGEPVANKHAWSLILPVWLVLLLNGFYLPTLSRVPAAYWIVEVVAWLALPGLLVVKAHSQGLLLPMPRKQSSAWLAWFLALIIGCVYYLSVRWAGPLLRATLPEMPWDWGYYDSLVPTQNPGRMLVAVYFALTAGIVEELFFRGLPLRLFERPAAYVFVTSVVFSFCHWENGFSALVLTFWFGVMTSSVFWYTRRIVPLIVMHALYDGLHFYGV